MAINLKGELKINVPQVNLKDYFYVLAGIPKSGKTTLFAKITEEYFGDVSKSLLFAFEKGYQALKVQAVDINDWDDVEEYIDQLIEEKEELGIELIGWDTGDIAWEMAQQKVIDDWNAKNPKKRTNDIGGVGAKGNSNQGFGVGYNLAKKLIRQALDRLMKAGYGVMVLTHSKDKEVEEKSGAKYNQLNVSLPASARDIFVNMADFITFITIEREEGGSKRYLYFRTDGYVEAGSRFKNVPERIEYSTKGFVDVITKAIESEFETGTDLKQIKAEQEKAREERAKEYIEQEKAKQSADELIEEISALVKSADASQRKEIGEKFKEILGGSANYQKVDDTDLLQQCIETAKEVISQ